MKTKEFKKKVKDFWEENKVEILIGTSVGLVLSAVLAGQYYNGVRKATLKGYAAGFMDGGVIGMHEGFKWIDKTFPEESKACELFERFTKENPDKMIKYIVGK